MSFLSQFGLTDEQIVYELGSVLHSYILDILGYGIYTGIYFVALYLTLSRGTERPRVGSAILITILWILDTVHVSINWAYLANVYIRHGETREAQITWQFKSKDEFLPQSITNTVVTFINLLSADLTTIWRCWVLYGRRWHIIFFPLSSLVVGSVCYIWRTITMFGLDGIWKTDKVTNLELIFLSTTVLTNIFCTTVIVCRIVSTSGWRKSLQTYRRFTEILIESSVLYTVSYMIRIGLQVHSQYFTDKLDERMRFAVSLGNSMTGIAPTLVIARVAAGFARPNDSWTRTSLPHMGSTMRSLAESSMQFGRRSVTDTDTGRPEWSASNRLGEEVLRDVSSESLLSSDDMEKVGERVHFKRFRSQCP